MRTSSMLDVAGSPAHSRSAPGRAALSGVMLAGCAVFAAAAQLLAPAVEITSVVADPDLARLMQGMAFIKLALVALMAGLLVWRFGRPMTVPVTLGYLACIWTVTAATVLIWQSSWLGLASVLFHGAGFAFMVIGLRDDRVLPSSLRTRAQP